ncbi:MAG: tetratricopeptide repeat protein [candidate division KSB1 bacterium]|nr:tetratricopeptide repeat protein [candidate division KSB1 bacterium]
MPQPACPSDESLHQFRLGQLADDIAGEVAAHLEVCATCCKRLEALSEAGQHLPADPQLERPLEGTAPLTPVSGATVLADRPPDLADYELLEPIGHGGMGVVWRVRDLRLNREVALKTLQSDYATHTPAVDRFQTEAQLTAQLQHPGIPPVHEVGTLPDGRPYLVMKLVKGRTVHDLLKERSRLPSPSGRGGGGEGLGRFLAIFEQVCHAVGYAHAHHVIHRDLKPANIMVGAHGEVQVMDWGLAKLLDPHRERERPEKEDDPRAAGAFVTAIETPQRGDSATHTGSMIGTPAYMSPEQAAGDIRKLDPRSDVFALGAILFQLLTGRPVYTGKTPHEVRLQAIRGELGPALEALAASQAEPELIALCRQCLAFRQEDRPADGNAVAAEVARIRQAAEERARQAELARARAEVAAAEQRKRRRVWLMAAGATAAVLLLGLAGTSIGYYQARQAADRERFVRVEAQMRRRQAEEARQRAESAADQERQAHELARRRLEQIVRSNKILATVFQDLDVRAVRSGDRPLEAVLAARLRQAGQQLDDESVGDLLMLAGLQELLGISLLNLGFPIEASQLFQRSLNTRQAHLGPNHPETLSSMSNLAIAYSDSGQIEQALPLHKQAFDQRLNILGLKHFDTLASLNNLALAYIDAGQLDKALPLLEQSLELRVSILGMDHPQNLIAMNNLALGHAFSGHYDNALSLFQKTFSMMNDLLGSDHPDTLDCMNNLANSLIDAGHREQALELHKQALALRKSRLGTDHSDTLDSMHHLAGAYQSVGQNDEALKLFEETLKLRRIKLGSDHPDTLATMDGLGVSYCSTGRIELSVSTFQEVFQSTKMKLGSNHPDTLRSMGNLAVAYSKAGKLDNALPLLIKTLELMRDQLGEEHPETFRCMNNLAACYFCSGELDLAKTLFEEVCSLRIAKFGKQHPDSQVSIGNLSIVRESLRNLNQEVIETEKADGAKRPQFQFHPSRTIVRVAIDSYIGATR